MKDSARRPWLELQGPHTFRVILEEDQCGAAYAYLLDGADIVGDVWLYNVVPSPTDAPWMTQAAEPPFLNPGSLCKEDVARRTLETVTRVEARWGEGGTVELFFDDRREARMWPGSRPGESFMASSKGPLASPLDRP
ncbi:hypothetical protein [Terrabacter sp. BE26]|uniref:hypothetical protein n=1 Tax=Terrabacter sp. BE26 TaxID=2898152 RepID=UPI0035BE9030